LTGTGVYLAMYNALPRLNCLDVVGMLALSVATKHCHGEGHSGSVAADRHPAVRVINWWMRRYQISRRPTYRHAVHAFCGL